MFSYGEIGYDIEGTFSSLDDTLEAAKAHSIASGEAAVEVLNENDERAYVCVEGELFELVKSK